MVMTTSQTDPFVPYVRIEDGERWVEVTGKYAVSVKTLLGKDYPILAYNGECLGVMYWVERADGTLERHVYTTTPAMLDYLPNPQNLIELAILDSSTPLNPWHELCRVDQVYRVYDMRGGFELGLTYLVSTGRLTDAWRAPHLSRGAVYYYQEEGITPDKLLTYQQLVELIQRPPHGTAVLDAPVARGGWAPEDYYNAGIRLIIVNETAIYSHQGAVSSGDAA